MTYRGHIENGSLVLECPVAIPEGTKIECVVVAASREGEAPAEPLADAQERVPPGAWRAGLRRGIMAFAGKATGLPADSSENLHHYLYGHAKR